VSSIRMMGLPVSDLSRSELLERLESAALARRDRPALAFALHVGGLLEIDDPSFVSAMSAAEIVYADGVSAKLLARLAGARRIERAVTTDVGWELLWAFRRATGAPARVALVGGPPELAENALAEMARVGAATPAFSAHGYHEDWDEVIEELCGAEPDLLFVGLGAPKEMLWAWRHQHRLPAALVMTCGGWFGYIVGDELRAPELMRRLGLEWLFRLRLQPRRLVGRYARGLVRFPLLAARVLWERLAKWGD
jgi:N-acetylglucosaminyldiphosphoundecaprenol N-acetyl-beta-D-mannosaminyltransferase